MGATLEITPGRQPSPGLVRMAEVRLGQVLGEIVVAILARRRGEDLEAA